jgi:hypothetical protein
MSASPSGPVEKNAEVEIETRILRWISDAFPGFLELELYDANQQRHLIHDKVPVLFLEALKPEDSSPESCWIQCKVIEAFDTFSVVEPRWHIESIEGQTRFEIEHNRIRAR